MIKDTPQGQTHSFNDGCGEPAHNETQAQKIRKNLQYYLAGNYTDEEWEKIEEVVGRMIDEGYQDGKAFLGEQKRVAYQEGYELGKADGYDKCVYNHKIEL